MTEIVRDRGVEIEDSGGDLQAGAEAAEAAAARLRVAAREIEARPWRVAAVLDEVIAWGLKARERRGV